MHEFGIIGLHTKPDAAFTEIDALNVVYDKVEKRFGTPASSLIHQLLFQRSIRLYYDAELRIKYHSLFFTTLSLLITEHQLYHTLDTIQYGLCPLATSTVPLYNTCSHIVLSMFIQNNMLFYDMFCYALPLIIYLLCYTLLCYAMYNTYLVFLQNILIAGDLNADCSYLSRSKMSTLSIRQDSAYTWLINDSQDTTVGSTDCAYDRCAMISE